METETGTIEHTTLYRDFYEYVVGKFGSMANFSMMVSNGNRMKLTSIERKTDNDETRFYIEKLTKIAQQLACDESLIYISKAEIDKIVKRVYDKAEINKTSVNKWLVAEKFNPSAYYAIINGANIFKNKSYQQLMKILSK